MFIFHTADVVWDEIEVSIDGLETVDELMTSVSSAMNECRRGRNAINGLIYRTGATFSYLRDENVWKRFFIF